MTIVVYILAAIIVLIIFLAAIAPKTYDVSRSVEINGTKEKIWPYLKFLEKQREWSPWARKDPNMDTKLIGTDGEVGAISYWNGNKDVGEGEQEITKIVEGERAEGELRFLKPMKSQSDCYLILEEQSSGKSKVTWGFKGKSTFPFSILMLFMSMDKMVGKDFEEGLRTLKSKMEQ
ncbi:SRPBCC family protein [Maribacter aurantiacus]|uniref:Polyketide cyclase n=1 Tax=Maribacter aurantiacus TaxID=1882343 RepID=A0A5R8M398_9FLAO|nr:SRPBCC family protein [Maribacter aurantiacus]TLF44053.1 polyketide cyclase [Maribacter aurantiacus]